jgi:hypothetical protein
MRPASENCIWSLSPLKAPGYVPCVSMTVLADEKADTRNAAIRNAICWI